MITKAKVVARSLTALVLGVVFAASVLAGTPDRRHRFGDDMDELPVLNSPPNSEFGAFTLDSHFSSTLPTPTDASDLSFSGGPTYFNAGSVRWPGRVPRPAVLVCSSTAPPMCCSARTGDSAFPLRRTTITGPEPAVRRDMRTSPRATLMAGSDQLAEPARGAM